MGRMVQEQLRLKAENRILLTINALSEWIVSLDKLDECLLLKDNQVSVMPTFLKIV